MGIDFGNDKSKEVCQLIKQCIDDINYRSESCNIVNLGFIRLAWPFEIPGQHLKNEKFRYIPNR